MSNIDLLQESGREIVFVTESLSQQVNSEPDDDYMISGQYDYFIGTNEVNLDKDAFHDTKDAMKLFVFLLDNVLKAYPDHTQEKYHSFVDNFETL